MAITKVVVLLNGAPMAGASVWVGEIGGQEKTTDEDGVVALPDITPPWQGYTEVLVGDGPDGPWSAKVLLVAGQDNVVNLGEIDLE